MNTTSNVSIIIEFVKSREGLEEELRKLAMDPWKAPEVVTGYVRRILLMAWEEVTLEEREKLERMKVNGPLTNATWDEVAEYFQKPVEVRRCVWCKEELKDNEAGVAPHPTLPGPSVEPCHRSVVPVRVGETVASLRERLNTVTHERDRYKRDNERLTKAIENLALSARYWLEGNGMQSDIPKEKT